MENLAEGVHRKINFPCLLHYRSLDFVVELDPLFTSYKFHVPF